MSLPHPLSQTYFSTWSTAHHGAAVLESISSDHGEEWIGAWEGVGLYEGNDKLAGYESLAVHLTNYRLILIPDSQTSTLKPIQTNLNFVRQTEYYSGFMRSSPKLTLTLGPPPAGYQGEEGGWSCRVCGFVNERNNLARVSKCGLCGVPYALATTSSNRPSRTGTPESSTSVPSQNIESANKDEVACPACTFLNSSLLVNCEICTTPLPRPQKGNTPPMNQVPEKHQVIRLSFRQGGEKDAYKKLKSVLGDKAWERQVALGQATSPVDGANGDPIRPSAGIDGILQSIDLNAKAQDSHMQSAFADLEALMLRAGEMVKLAQSLNVKLSAQQNQNTVPPGGRVSEEEATMIRTSLVQLGLAAPALTKEMAKSELAYHEGLAKELSGLLTGRGHGKEGLMGEKGRGVIGLDEVWGLWMRARGVALLPPQKLVDILPYLPTYTSPSIQSLSLPSTLTVLHTPLYSPTSILSRTLDRLEPQLSPSPSLSHEKAEMGGEEKSFSLIEFASQESLPLGLAQEYLHLIETQGGLLRDDQAGQADGGVRWYRDIITGWPLN